MSDYQKELTDLSEDLADSFEELSDALVKAGKLLAEQAETFNVTMARAAEPFIRVMEAVAANLPGWDAGLESTVLHSAHSGQQLRQSKAAEAGKEKCRTEGRAQ